MPPLRDTTVTLPDGRRLAYTEWGSPTGTPVLSFHGRPHSRLWCPDEEATAAANVRLIIPDRPGIGRSDPLEGRTIGDWPRDVAALADALGISTFGVIGTSGGGPYAAACAALIPERLLGVAEVSSITAGYDWAERPSVLERWPVRMQIRHAAALRSPAEAAELAAELWDTVLRLAWTPENEREEIRGVEGDRWILDDPARLAPFEAAIREWSRQGRDGVKWDIADVVLPWGFRLADISIPVTLWRGAQDLEVTAEDIEFAASVIPNSTAITWPDCGHLGSAKHWAEVLEAVVRPRSDQRGSD